MRGFRKSASLLCMCGSASAFALALDEPQEPPARTPTAAIATDDLTRLAPASEDSEWQSEAFAARAAKQLKSLAHILESASWDGNSLKGIAAPDAQSDDLDPEPLRTHSEAGGILVTNWSPGGPSTSSAPLVGALRRLHSRLHEHGDRVRVKTKIVGVTIDDGALSTQVRIEAFTDGADRRRQQVSHWRVSWKDERAGDGADHPAGAPHMTGIQLLKHQTATTSGAAFVDVTKSLVADDDALLAQLARGAHFWHGRVDALGEWMFFGHNGIAVGDVNGDGREDIYLAMGAGLPNKLLIQQPDGSVRDTAAEAGVAWLDDTKGVLFADMDNDGDKDLLCAIGPTIVLCHNDGTGKFDNFVHMRAPTPASFYSISVADYDLDGRLDIYGCRYVAQRYGVSVPTPFHDANNGPTNHLLRNVGDGKFVDVTHETGLAVNNTRFSLAAAWADYDDDGDPDLYVANDFGRNNLYRNDGGKFVDVAAIAGVEDQAAGMGAAWSDYDMDGDLDLYVSNMFSSAGQRVAYQPAFMKERNAAARAAVQRHSIGNSLFTNDGDGRFTDTSDEAGVRMGRWAWGAKFVDLNNDGLDDIVVPNGFLTNTKDDDL